MNPEQQSELRKKGVEAAQEISPMYGRSSIFACLYWVCLLRSILSSGTTFYDPDAGGCSRMPSILEVELNQAYGAVFFIAIVIAANCLERRLLRAEERRRTRDAMRRLIINSRSS